MTQELRFRIITLQAVLVLVLGFCSGFLYWGSSFVNGMIHDQLAAQLIYFPTSDSASLKALPAENASAMQLYAGQQLTTGDQAKVYAENFIGEHLKGIAGGKTYSQASTAALANPKDATLSAQVQTLFRGETLKGLLLNAWGWSQVGMYAFYMAIGLTVAAFAVFCAMVFELSMMSRAVQARPKGDPVS